MGVRTTRYCDITGTDTDVTHHELQIDQMHVEIDLTTTEYERLLAALQPFIDAGRCAGRLTRAWSPLSPHD